MCIRDSFEEEDADFDFVAVSKRAGPYESGLVPPSAGPAGSDDAWSDEGDDDAKPAPASAAPSAPPMAKEIDRRPAIPTVRELLHQTPAAQMLLAARATAGDERRPSHAKATKPCPRCTFANSFEATQCEMCEAHLLDCLLYTSPSPRDRTRSRMPSSA